MRYVVFECRKCGHNLYVENTEDLFKKIGRVSNYDCPACGEEPDGNWVLLGLKKEFPVQEGGAE
ncbi:MAG: hypothetical protein IKA62_06365 [Clostridia bacterium]|nr:hypothetical protein [Clostridia bacterium]